MSMYGLNKETSRIKRNDTIADLRQVNGLRWKMGLDAISPKKPSVRALENAVAIALKDIKNSELMLVRGESFYRSILEEIEK